MGRRSGFRRTFAVVGVAMTGLVVTSAPAAADGTTHRVHEGESIQAAIDAAEPGDKIHIEAGTYFENVYVTTDFIELEGDGADETFLRPPDVATPNPCVEGDEIFGAVCVGLTDDPVEGFELEDMTIDGFLNGAFLVNTVGAEVEDMVFANNSEYGAFYNSSTGGDFHDNVAYGSEEAGLYFGDSENADVTIEDNEVYDNTFGIFIRDAANGEVEDNDAHDNCYGLFLLDTGEPERRDGMDSRGQQRRQQQQCLHSRRAKVISRSPGAASSWPAHQRTASRTTTWRTTCRRARASLRAGSCCSRRSSSAVVCRRTTSSMTTTSVVTSRSTSTTTESGTRTTTTTATRRSRPVCATRTDLDSSLLGDRAA